MNLNSNAQVWAKFQKRFRDVVEKNLNCESESTIQTGLKLSIEILINN